MRPFQKKIIYQLIKKTVKYEIYIIRNKNYKNKLNILIKKLIHIVDVNEEISINNKIKDISDFISSLLK